MCTLVSCPLPCVFVDTQCKHNPAAPHADIVSGLLFIANFMDIEVKIKLQYSFACWMCKHSNLFISTGQHPLWDQATVKHYTGVITAFFQSSNSISQVPTWELKSPW